MISWRAEPAGGYGGMKAEFQRKSTEIDLQWQPELDVKELKLGHISSPRVYLREAIVREVGWDPLIPDTFASGPPCGWRAPAGATLTPQLHKASGVGPQAGDEAPAGVGRVSR